MSTILVLSPPFCEEVIVELINALKNNKLKFTPQVLFILGPENLHIKNLILKTDFKASYSRVSYIEKSSIETEAKIFRRILNESKRRLIDHMLWFKSEAFISIEEITSAYETYSNSQKDAMFYTRDLVSSRSLLYKFLEFRSSSSKFILFKLPLFNLNKFKCSADQELFFYFFFGNGFQVELINGGKINRENKKVLKIDAIYQMTSLLLRKYFSKLALTQARDRIEEGGEINYIDLDTYRTSEEKKGFHCDLPSKLLSISNEGIISSCCMSLYDNESRYLPSIDNSKSLKKNWELSIGQKIKKDFNEGRIPDSCLICLKSEKETGSSYRLSSIFSNEIPEEVENELFPKVEFVELKLGNNCNLACRMCNPLSTDRLIDEFRGYYGEDNSSGNIEKTNWYKDPGFWKQLLLKSKDLKKINFAGGEPLITKEAWGFLKGLIDQGDSDEIEVSYNTNLTVLPSQAYEIWPKFKSIHLFVSIDGYGEMYEYIRFPGKWATTLEKIKIVSTQLKNLNIGRVKFAYTISAYNLRHLVSFLDFLETEIPENLSPYPDLQLVENPIFLDFRVLPDEERLFIGELLAEKLLRLMDIEDDEFIKDRFVLIKSIKMLIKRCRNHNTLSSEWDEFKKFTKFFDEKRSQDILDVYPELKKYY